MTIIFFIVVIVIIIIIINFVISCFTAIRKRNYYRRSRDSTQFL